MCEKDERSEDLRGLNSQILEKPLFFNWNISWSDSFQGAVLGFFAPFGI